MANRVEGVTEKILECAMQEFIMNGYVNASLRTISEKAGTTPRSVYTRYGSKEGLFAALVEEPLRKMIEIFKTTQESYHERPLDLQQQLFHDEEFEQEYEGYMHHMVRHIYDNYDAFKLLVCHSEGTEFAGFIDEMVALDEHYTLLYIEHTKNDIFSSGRAKPQLVHLLCSSFMHGFFEFIRHDMPYEEAMEYLYQLREFYECGWDNLLNNSK